MITSSKIRQQFISFFANKGHKVVPSAPSVPHGDSTLMFTNAGMNQFKDVFLGTGTRDYTRAVDTQKCVRVSGKHNDLEEVGVDNYHHTFFEMLGNWSFGDYYKESAIKFAWELLTDVWKLDKSRIFATVYKTDDESYEIWKNYLPENRILRFAEKDNFWEMGSTGPCGPASEIHYDGTEDRSGRDLVNMDHQDVIEIWNLVFIEFNRNEDGSLSPLNNKHVDTGMGFERITRVLQGKSSNYDTDIFEPILKEIEVLTGKKYTYSQSESDIAFRVMADHIRTLAITIADGALPGSDGRGYVLRRILRRARRYASILGQNKPILYKLTEVISKQLGDVFPELVENQETITRIVKAEEESFLQTLEKGLAKFDELIEDDKSISGKHVFLLYDTYGFPPDLTSLIGKEKNISIDLDGFDQYMQEQKERSRSARKSQSISVSDDDFPYVSEFLGYENTSASGKIIWMKGSRVVVDKTPFYAEKGGQISDKGIVTSPNFRADVISVTNHQNAIILELAKSGEGIDTDAVDSELAVGDVLFQEVDADYRNDIKRNHSATHLLHAALIANLGAHIKQQGSMVTAEYLRFDYNHYEKPSKELLNKIEAEINGLIFKSTPVVTEILTLDEAQNRTEIKQFFGDKYGSEVRAVSMGSMTDKGNEDNSDREGVAYSIELCGGTHVSNTAEIGLFKIISDASVASGIRRIEAVTGRKVYQQTVKQRNENEELESKLDEKNKVIKDLEKKIKKMSVADLETDFSDIINTTQTVGNTEVFTYQFEGAMDMDQLREIGDGLRSKMADNCIGLLASITDDKVSLVCIVADGIKKTAPAGKLVGMAAKQLGGGGGGKPHMATAGGRQPEKLPELLSSGFVTIVKEFLRA